MKEFRTVVFAVSSFAGTLYLRNILLSITCINDDFTLNPPAPIDVTKQTYIPESSRDTDCRSSWDIYSSTPSSIVLNSFFINEYSIIIIIYFYLYFNVTIKRIVIYIIKIIIKTGIGNVMQSLS